MFYCILPSCDFNHKTQNEEFTLVIFASHISNIIAAVQVAFRPDGSIALDTVSPLSTVSNTYILAVWNYNIKVDDVQIRQTFHYFYLLLLKVVHANWILKNLN